MWKPKMCRLALQLLGMLCNVLSMLCNVLGMLCKVLGQPRHASARSKEYMEVGGILLP